MRSAPSVIVPVGRSRFGAGLAYGAWGLGLAALVYACLVEGSVGLAQALTAAALAVCGPLALAAARRQPEGELAWDGAAWHWQPRSRGPVREVEVVMACDLQRWILLRLAPRGRSGGATWVWLESGACADWLAVRRAVYSPAASDARPGGPAPTP